MQLFQFIGAAIGGSVFVVFASLIWPRVTNQPRPEALTKVREIAIQTSAGHNLAQVLGVTEESSIQSTSIHDVVTTGTNAAIDAVTKSAQHAVTTKILESLGNQFNNLPEEEKQTFRAQICLPVSE